MINGKDLLCSEYAPRIYTYIVEKYPNNDCVAGTIDELYGMILNKCPDELANDLTKYTGPNGYWHGVPHRYININGNIDFSREIFVSGNDYSNLEYIRRILYIMLLASSNINRDRLEYKYTIILMNSTCRSDVYKKFIRSYYEFVFGIREVFNHLRDVKINDLFHSMNPYVAGRVEYERWSDQDVGKKCFDIMSKFFGKLLNPKQILYDRLHNPAIYEYMNDVEFVYYDINEDKFYEMSEIMELDTKLEEYRKTLFRITEQLPISLYDE